MSYWDIAEMSQDNYLQQRIVACAVQEGKSQDWARENFMLICGSPGWAEAWASASANPDIENPGKDPGVITDGQILSAVQGLPA